MSQHSPQEGGAGSDTPLQETLWGRGNTCCGHILTIPSVFDAGLSCYAPGTVHWPLHVFSVNSPNNPSETGPNPMEGSCWSEKGSLGQGHRARKRHIPTSNSSVSRAKVWILFPISSASQIIPKQPLNATLPNFHLKCYQIVKDRKNFGSFMIWMVRVTIIIDYSYYSLLFGG